MKRIGTVTFYECWLRVDGQNLVQARCENFRFDRADGRMNSCMK
ncbi:MAG: hypothetical protein ABSF28_02995 [Terracidiphilus sp.]